MFSSVADPEKLHQMTLNLILNAIQASHNDGDARECQLANARRSGGPVDLCRLWDRYQREPTWRRCSNPFIRQSHRDRPGTHGGQGHHSTATRAKSEIDSGETRGTTVTIVLPLYTE